MIRSRSRSRSRDGLGISGTVTVRKYGPSGELLLCIVTHNLVTAVGDQMYGERGAGIAGALAVPTGMKLGTDSTPTAKSGAGSALGAYVSGSDAAFDATFPSTAPVTVLGVTSWAITYQCSWVAGVATTLVPVTEVVLVNDAIADATSSSAHTIGRALVGSPLIKDSGQLLVVEWAHHLRGT